MFKKKRTVFIHNPLMSTNKSGKISSPKNPNIQTYENESMYNKIAHNYNYYILLTATIKYYSQES